MNPSQIISLISTYLPVVLKVVEEIVKAVEADPAKATEAAKGRVAVSVNFGGNGEPEQAEGVAGGPGGQAEQPAKRGPGRPKKSDATQATLSAAASAKLTELAGKGAPDDEAKALVRKVLADVGGVSKVRDVPAEKLAAVQKAIEALDYTADNGEGDDEI